LTYEGKKYSKSNNDGVYGTEAEKSGIPSEVWRYYLLSNRPESSDSDFNWDDLISRNNNELIKNIGNFCNRPLSFVKSSYQSVIPAHNSKFESVDTEMIESVNAQLKLYIAALEECKIRLGCQIAMNISSIGNKYLQDTEFWELFKKDKERCAVVLNLSLELVLFLASLFNPYLPATSRNILNQLNLSSNYLNIPDKFEPNKIPSNHKINEPKILFNEIKKEQAEKFRQLYGGSSKKFSLDLRGGTVLSAQDHPLDKDLFVLQVDVGNSEKRQIVGRLKQFYTEKDIVGKKVVVLCNLPTTKINGTDSEGMCLVAEKKKRKKTKKINLNF